MKKDIESRSDIEKLINTFYDKVKTDKIIGYFFTDVVNVNWEKHLPVMYDFWEQIVFETNFYKGNPMQPHLNLNAQSPMKDEHFRQWLLLFTDATDALFAGEKAELIKQRATGIATVMQIKMSTKTAERT